MQVAEVPPKGRPRRAGFDWRLMAYSLFESADSSWSAVIVSIYMGAFVQQTLHRPGADFGLAATIGAILIALLSPALGAAVDISGPRKPYMRFFVGMVVILTAGLAFVHSYALAVALYAGAYLAVNGGFNFFLSMLPANTREDRVHSTVSLAVSVGYVGGLICLILFHFTIPDDRPELVFLPMAGFYLLYALPNLLFARDFPRKEKTRLNLGRAYADVWRTLRAARLHKSLFRFLIADFLYENAVAAVITLISVYARNVVGFTAGELTLVFLPALVISAATAFAFSWLVRKIGAKKSVLVDLGIWLLLLGSAMVIQDKMVFGIVVAPLTGMGLAGVWSSSRVLLTALTPAAQSGKFWGLYNLSGRSASVIGDLTWTVVLLLVGETVFGYKAALGALAVYVILGALVLLKVPDVRPTEENVLTAAN